MKDKITDQLLQIPSTRKQVSAAIAASIIIVAVSVSVLPFGTNPMIQIQPFLPAFIAWFLFADLLTAHMLFSQYRAAGNRSILILAATYLFTGLIIIPHILTFPGVFSAAGLLGAGTQTAIWLWVGWHAGFPLGILAYLLAGHLERDKPLQPPTIWQPIRVTLIVLLLVAAAGTAAVLFKDSLPVLVNKGVFTPLMYQRVGPAVWLINAAAIVLLFLMKRGRTVLNLWLTVAVLAFMLDVTVTIFAGSRYSLGWYLARVNSLVSAFVIICAIVYEVNRLYVRLAKHQKALLQSREELYALNDELSRLSQIDGLTGIANRRRFDELLHKQLKETESSGYPFSLLLLDIDYFKAYNDHYGHQSGDRVLKQTAQLIANTLPDGTATAARYGGEEFAVLLPGKNKEQAMLAAEAIRSALTDARITHEHSAVAPHITLSIGAVALTPVSGAETCPLPGSLVEAADQALYASKSGGRNRVTFAS
ncbi:sensor domain-containing diguanylate cyclase [Paenibacillus pasadenensis]|uniref:sensor domain-containing diguanylate cyclase n=1 Tax=Paenibacillus pasadenensis TaxID=217090 RepID=UPI00203AB310|nr:GGDEF domain-containing protein [Paenibacillus pasadenensis]